jgi:hypothetical protein
VSSTSACDTGGRADDGDGELRLTQGLYGVCGTGGLGADDLDVRCAGFSGGENWEVRASSAPSRASLKMRPMALSGFESESPVR